MQSKYIKRYETFCRSLNNLLRCKNLDIRTDCVLEGTIQRFNLTFDISWKVMKDILIKEKCITEFATGSPRDTLRTAYSCKIIDSDIWLQMLKVRNTSVHDYDGNFAEESFSIIVNEFCDAFVKFRDNVSGYYIEGREIDDLSAF